MAAPMTDSTADLAAVGLIPLLADEVTEGVRMTISYGGRAVARGETLATAAAASPPTITLTEAGKGRSAGTSAGTAFTILCVDPHAPSPKKPTLACWVRENMKKKERARWGGWVGMGPTPPPPPLTRTPPLPSSLQLHCLLTNAPEPDVSRADVVVPYAGPSPPAGTHAYVWLAYRQPAGPLGGVRAPKARSRFQTKAWAADHGLGHPSAATFFWVSAGEE